MGTTNSGNVQAKIQLRRNAFSSDAVEIKFKHNETLGELIKRSLLEAGYPVDSKLEEYFQVLKDGVIVDRELYGYLKVSEESTYLVAPKIARGEGGQIFKQVLILAIAVTATVLFPPSAGIWSGLAAAAITVGGSLLVNALIPPPSIATSGVSVGSIEEQSQMYTVTGQSNTIQRYGIVPRVYGSHRIFPKLAATPYLSLEENPETGKWEQYYHAVFDFGLGPSTVTDIRIGDTAISELEAANYNFVNPRGGLLTSVDFGVTVLPDIVFVDDPLATYEFIRVSHVLPSGGPPTSQIPITSITLIYASMGDFPPDIAIPLPVKDVTNYYACTGNNTVYEAVWDVNTFVRWREKYKYNRIHFSNDFYNIDPNHLNMSVSPNFGLYKGTVNSEAIGVVLEKNSQDTSPVPSSVEVTVTRSVTTDLVQTGLDRRYIEVDMSFPRGLVAHSSAGAAGDREVLVEAAIGYKTGTNPDGSSAFGGWTPFIEVNSHFDEFETSGVVTTGNTTFYLRLADPSKVPFCAQNTSTLIQEINYTRLYGLKLQDQGGGNYLIPVEGNPHLPVTFSAGAIKNSGAGGTENITVTGPAYYSGVENIYLIPATGYPLSVRNFWYGWAQLPYGQTSPWPATPTNLSEWHSKYPEFIVPTRITGTQTFAIRIGEFIHKIRVQTTRSILKFTASSTTPVYASVKARCAVFSQFGMSEEIAVRLTRIQSNSANTLQIMDALSVDRITLRHGIPPVNSPESHTLLEVKIKATNQLQGQIDNLSGIVHSAVPMYDDFGEWRYGISNNPAWIFADLLTGRINRKAVDLSRLHGPSIREWADYCDESIASPNPPPIPTPRFAANFILDFKATLQSILNSVGGMAQASLNIIDGKYGVLVDKKKTTPVQVFTPRNSSNIVVARNYVDLPHAFKVKYIDPAKWDVREVLVFSGSYNQNTATEFEEVTAFGCTNYSQAWRYGRYLLAQAMYRQDTITLEVDYENIVCTRGDYVQIAQDVLAVGGTPARILDIDITTSGTTITRTITLDDNIEFTTGDYGIVIRNPSNIVTLPAVMLTPDTITVSTEVGSDITVDVGDLVVVGERGKEVMDCIIKSISPMDDYKAQLVLVERANEIHDYSENMSAMAPYVPEIDEATDEELTPEAVISYTNDGTTWDVSDGKYVYTENISWTGPMTDNWEHFEVYRLLEGVWTLTGITHTRSISFIATDAEVVDGYQMKVLAVSPKGKKIPLEDAPIYNGTVEINDNPPQDVACLDLDVGETTATLKWTQLTALDIVGYVIRYTSDIHTPSWASATHVAEVGKVSSLSVSRVTGTYLIKAKALNLNLSENPSMAITDIPDSDAFVGDTVHITNYPWNSSEGVYVDTEILEEGTPDSRVVLEGVWTGSTWNTVANEGSLILEVGGSVDLSLPRPTIDPYEVELESVLDVREIPFTARNLMAAWSNLAALTTLVQDTPTHVDCRVVSQISVDGGVTWETFTKKKYSLTDFRLRHLLTTNDSEYTPVMLSGGVNVNYLKYSKHYEGVTIPDTGATFVHDEPFYGPVTPLVKVTIDCASEGDYYVITSNTTTGFDIDIFDKNDIQVSRAVDIQVTGF